MAGPGEEGVAKYLTIEALDFISERLDGGPVNWRQLAGQLHVGYTTLDLNKFTTQGLKDGESAPKALLLDWERRCGGCDVGKLKDSLKRIGRNDILRDLYDYYENQGKEIVEPRHIAPKILDVGQDIVIKGKVYPDGKVSLDPNVTWVFQDSGLHRHQGACPVDSHSGRGMPSGHSDVQRQEYHSLDPSQQRDLSTQARWSSPGLGREGSKSSVVIEQDFHVSTKRHSDPLQRKESSSQSSSIGHGSGSLDSVRKAEPESPVNLKKIYSESPISINCAPSVAPPKVTKEEEGFQRGGDYGELRSVPPANSIGNGHLPRHAAAEGLTRMKRYLIVSSVNEQDKMWSRKLCKILEKKGHQTWMLNSLFPEEILPTFRTVDYVLVIYTDHYKREFQQRGNTNGKLFDAMQKEFKTKGSNRRFIPVYDVNAIHQLPDALMSGQSQERDYILQLLSRSNKNPSNVHSSAPSEGGVGGAVGGAGVAPIRCNHQHLSKSEPVIQQEFHTPQPQHKPANPEKKETQSKFFNKFKSKKGK
ncbi:uncharacterized protein LOC121421402 [Lytechinus variegatus]|uniref:uncharacterized protein LOC121421402 n=1 Tax=Lytechinus variegatus TaxID=7654 RepID=UPI001BB249F1|nr:uncharacterized protein LOC121421402 [Lytechinus variegatus]